MGEMWECQLVVDCTDSIPSQVANYINSIENCIFIASFTESSSTVELQWNYDDYAEVPDDEEIEDLTKTLKEEFGAILTGGFMYTDTDISEWWRCAIVDGKVESEEISWICRFTCEQIRQIKEMVREKFEEDENGKS